MVILMDLVVNHCSDEHEWFKKACEDPDGKYGKYFYLCDKGEETNWRAAFGGPAWDELPGTDKMYLHTFHKKQPDLNWENPELRAEVYKNMNWWLDRGLGGFRLDAIMNIKKAFPFVNYEPDGPDGLCSIQKMLVNAHGIGEFLGEMKRETFDRHDAFSVGEVFGVRDDEIKDFIGDDGYFSSMFDFTESSYGFSDFGWDWFQAPEVTPDSYKSWCFQAQRQVADIGFYSNIIENHDQPRGVSHYIRKEDLSVESKKMLAALNFMMRGLPFLYQGQELGMENTVIDSIEEVDDCGSINEYNRALADGYTEEEALEGVRRFSRDNARTPMQWSAEENAGFTTGKPWLKVNPNYTEINAEAQMNDPYSVRGFYKELIALRKNPEYSETVVYGTLEPVWEDRHDLMAYYRRADKTLLVVGNFQRDPQSIKLDAPLKKVLINNYPGVILDGTDMQLKGFQVIVAEL